jgi:DNA-directed RNA polymerase specialized sigma24 family protein
LRRTAFAVIIEDQTPENDMEPRTRKTPTSSALGARFEQTLWSEVIAAGQLGGPDSARALERLCQVYWYPIYAYLRRRGCDRHAAKDLTQGFFFYLVKKNVVQAADPQKGRFRSFLLGTLKNFVSNEEGRERALKRGGDQQLISLDEEVAEGRYAHEPVDNRSPEKLFDRRWALTVLEEASRRLESEFKENKAEREFSELKSFLNSDRGLSYAELAVRLGRSELALRSVVSRMRRRFRELLVEVIRDTVGDASQLEAEMTHLKAALRDT